MASAETGQGEAESRSDFKGTAMAEIVLDGIKYRLDIDKTNRGFAAN